MEEEGGDIMWVLLGPTQGALVLSRNEGADLTMPSFAPHFKRHVRDERTGRRRRLQPNRYEYLRGPITAAVKAAIYTIDLLRLTRKLATDAHRVSRREQSRWQ